MADLELSITSGGPPLSPGGIPSQSPGSDPLSSPGIQETSLTLTKSPRHSNASSTSLSPPPISPTQLEDGMLERDIDKNLQEDRKAIVSILRNKNKTPVKRESLLKIDENGPLSPSDGSSLRRNRPPGTRRECCIVL